MAKKHTFLAIILLTYLFITTLNSQKIEPKRVPLPIDDVTYCLIMDSYNFIWTGTQLGLIKYDGYSPKFYTQKPFDSTSLSANWVTAIKEDDQKNLWIGTWGGGLNYFNQKTDRFTHFKGDSLYSKNFANANVSEIIINNGGSLWVSTRDQGLFFINTDNNDNTYYKKYNLSKDPVNNPNSEDNHILTIYKNKQGKLWIGTRERGLKLLDPSNGKIMHFEHDPQDPFSISSNTVSSICEDESGNLWIGTGYWMTPKGRGLNRYNPITHRFNHFQHNPGDNKSICSNNIGTLLIDDQNVLWIGSVDNKLNSIPIHELLTQNNPQFAYYSNLNRTMISNLYQDKSGDIWITVLGDGVYKYTREKNPFIRYTLGTNKTGVSLTFNLWAIYPDKSGRIWFASVNEGLNYYQREANEYKSYTHIPEYLLGSRSNWITGICEDDNGFLWISTHSTGLFCLNIKDETYVQYKAKPEQPFGLVSNDIDRISKRTTGNLWIVTQKKGIQLYDRSEDRFYHYDPDTSIHADEEIFAFFEDHDGTLWIGTWTYGMYTLKFNNHELIDVQHFIHDPSNPNTISNNLVKSIIRPQVIDTNAVWIATQNGLNRLDLITKMFTHYYTEDGLPSNSIMQLLEDNSGNIWCSCSNIIAVYRIKTRKFQSYGKDDGLPFAGFTGLYQTAAKTEDGQIIFGGINDAVGFYSEQVKVNTYVPPIYLTDFNIFHQPVKLDTFIQFKKSIYLSRDQTVFSFDFTALNYTNSSNNQYAYKMEGFHDDWIYIGDKHTASFTNLDPGEYLFRVKGSNNHGIWNETGASIRVIILPPWWQTSWAYSAYVLIIATVLIGSLRFEIQRRQRKIENKLLQEQELRKLEQANHRAVIAELQAKTAEAQKEKEKEQIRSRIASDLHDEIGSNLSSIALISQIIEEKSRLQKSMKLRLQETQRIALLTAESMRDIVWFINPTNDDMDKLVVKMRATANLLLEEKDFTFKTPRKGITFQGDLNFRRNLFLIFKESLQNIIRHADATKIEIIFDQMDNLFIMHIRDNGNGFNVQKTYSGNGLKNFRSRAQEMEAKFEIISEKGKGTEIVLAMKIP